MQVLAENRRPSARTAIVAEWWLLSVSVALAIGGIGIVSLAVRRQRADDEREEPASTPSGDPELPDEPLGVPAEEPSENGDIELPGFPRNDPTHG